MPAATTLDLRDLPGPIGTEVLGLELSADGHGPLTRGDIDALREAFTQRHLLVVRGGALSGEAQVAFTARFGPLLAERALWGYVSNVRPDGIVGEGALLFHSDFAFAHTPVAAIALHAVEVPADGAPTLFADATTRRIPPRLRARLDGRRAVNCFDFGRRGDARMRLAEIDPRSPRFEHPIIGRDPRTGEEVVLANEMHTDHVVGLPEAESEELLAELFAVLYEPSHLYEHAWRPGDLVLWDNVAVHHGRRDIDEGAPRTLQRVVLGEYTPAELVPGLAELLATRRA